MKLTFVHAYYNNPDDLARQWSVWSNYPLHVREQLRIVIIDDGSPTPLAITEAPPFNLAVYRITKDVGFNLAACAISGPTWPKRGGFFWQTLTTKCLRRRARQCWRCPIATPRCTTHLRED